MAYATAKRLQDDLGKYLGSSQSEGPTLVPLHIRCRNITYTPKGPIILRTTHLGTCSVSFVVDLDGFYRDVHRTGSSFDFFSILQGSQCIGHTGDRSRFWQLIPSAYVKTTQKFRHLPPNILRPLAPPYNQILPIRYIFLCHNGM